MVIKAGKENCNVNAVLDHFNGADPDIKFTVEVEKDGCLAFLDTLVQRDQTGEYLKTTVYRKPTHSGRGLNYASHHHPSTMRGIISTMTTRAIRNTTEPADLKKECQILELEFTQNGYPVPLIRKVINDTKKRTEKKVFDPEERKKPFLVLPYNKEYDKDLKDIARKHGLRIINKTSPKLRGRLVHNQDKTPCSIKLV